MPSRRFPKRQQADVGQALGFRSGLEEQECERLRSLAIAFEYEPFRIPFTPPSKVRHYTPDILLLANGILVETKGRFITADRQKHLAVRAEHPDLDIRFVFSNANARISKTSKTTYADWCRHKGFQFAHRQIPQAWLTEPPEPKRLAAIQRLKENSQ